MIPSSKLYSFIVSLRENSMRDVMKHYGPKFDLMRRIIGKDNPVIVEIGAHFGEDSLRFAATFPGLQLSCFEPDPRCITAFKKYVNDPRISLYEVALSDAEGEATFYQSYEDPAAQDVPAKYDWIDKDFYNSQDLNNSGASSLKKGYALNKEKPIQVKTMRFDKWYETVPIETIDLVWLDVQGAEREVIEGMGTSIQHINLIWMEYGEVHYEGGLSRQETVDLLKTKNFIAVPQLSDNTPTGDLLFKRRGV